jgi:hypothetical protein
MITMWLVELAYGSAPGIGTVPVEGATVNWP